MNSELKAIVEAQDAKLAEHNAKLDAEIVVLRTKVERLQELAEEADCVAEQMTQLREKAQKIKAEKELLLAA